MLKNVFRIFLSRTFWFVFIFLLQMTFFFGLIYWFANNGIVAYLFLIIFSVVILVFILAQDKVNPAYKLMWTFVILLLPLFGAGMYILWGHRHVPRRHKARLQTISAKYNSTMRQNPNVIKALRQSHPYLAQNAYYLYTRADSPVYPADCSEFYPIGEEFFSSFLETLKDAKHFIFMQYYIWQPGYMLDSVLDILKQKVAEGVEVRILWDGVGSLLTLPKKTIEEMQSYNIQCCAFLPPRPTWHVSDYAMLNHRDHRKLTVVDGVVGFFGGLNFADEYINYIHRFGLWKDTACKITGEAVYSLTTTFLQAWDYASGTDNNPLDYFVPGENLPDSLCDEKGYVQPYWDSPLDEENVSENSYLNIINQATDYVYISTPYLILDHEMITALTLAAKKGVDVRILTPGIPDKKPVFWVTQSYYPVLLEGGVRIFEYTPGFVHAKMYVSDDKVSIVGSANMDYRSLYLHFENCVAFYAGHVVKDTKKDMLDSFSQAHEVTLQETENISFGKRILQTGAKFFSPLL